MVPTFPKRQQYLPSISNTLIQTPQNFSESVKAPICFIWSPYPRVADNLFQERFIMYFSTFLIQVILHGLCSAGYVLETSYTSANWFDLFSFQTVRRLISYPMYTCQSNSLLVSVCRPYGWLRELRGPSCSNQKWLHQHRQRHCLHGCRQHQRC